MRYYFLLIITLFVLVGTAQAAPAPWGMAINEDTEECAGYWSGDEFSSFSLPEGWTTYFPKACESSYFCIETAYGVCKDFFSGKEEECCEQLGLSYISENIGEGYSF